MTLAVVRIDPRHTAALQLADQIVHGGRGIGVGERRQPHPDRQHGDLAAPAPVAQPQQRNGERGDLGFGHRGSISA